MLVLLQAAAGASRIGGIAALAHPLLRLARRPAGLLAGHAAPLAYPGRIPLQRLAAALLVAGFDAVARAFRLSGAIGFIFSLLVLIVLSFERIMGTWCAAAPTATIGAEQAVL